MSDAPPAYPGINPSNPNYPPPSYNQTPYPAQNPQQSYGFNPNPAANGAPYPNSTPGPSYPALPQQNFGFNAPSAPDQPCKCCFGSLNI